jgi:hypothetical protein
MSFDEAVQYLKNNSQIEIMPQSVNKQKELDEFFTKDNVSSAIDAMLNNR